MVSMFDKPTKKVSLDKAKSRYSARKKQKEITKKRNKYRKSHGHKSVEELEPKVTSSKGTNQDLLNFHKKQELQKGLDQLSSGRYTVLDSGVHDKKAQQSYSFNELNNRIKKENNLLTVTKQDRYSFDKKNKNKVTDNWAGQSISSQDYLANQIKEQKQKEFNKKYRQPASISAHTVKKQQELANSQENKAYWKSEKKKNNVFVKTGKEFVAGYNFQPIKSNYDLSLAQLGGMVAGMWTLSGNTGRLAGKMTGKLALSSAKAFKTFETIGKVSKNVGPVVLTTYGASRGYDLFKETKKDGSTGFARSLLNTGKEVSFMHGIGQGIKGEFKV